MNVVKLDTIEKKLFREEFDKVQDGFNTMLNVDTKKIERTFLDDVIEPNIIESSPGIQIEENIVGSPPGGMKVSRYNRFFKGACSVEDFGTWKSSELSRTTFEKGGFVLERYIKVVDRYNENGKSKFDTALLQALSIDDGITELPGFENTVSQYKTQFFKGNDQRHDRLRGYVNVADWMLL